MRTVCADERRSDDPSIAVRPRVRRFFGAWASTAGHPHSWRPNTREQANDQVLTFEIPVDTGQGQSRVAQLEHNVRSSQESWEGPRELRHMAGVP